MLFKTTKSKNKVRQQRLIPLHTINNRGKKEGSRNRCKTCRFKIIVKLLLQIWSMNLTRGENPNNTCIFLIRIHNVLAARIIWHRITISRIKKFQLWFCHLSRSPQMIYWIYKWWKVLVLCWTAVEDAFSFRIIWMKAK